jgi:hypothetical protein
VTTCTMTLAPTSSQVSVCWTPALQSEQVSRPREGWTKPR